MSMFELLTKSKPLMNNKNKMKKSCYYKIIFKILVSIWFLDVLVLNNAERVCEDKWNFICLWCEVLQVDRDH